VSSAIDTAVAAVEASAAIQGVATATLAWCPNLDECHMRF
jgi:hypothetical protein